MKIFTVIFCFLFFVLVTADAQIGNTIGIAKSGFYQRFELDSSAKLVDFQNLFEKNPNNDTLEIICVLMDAEQEDHLLIEKVKNVGETPIVYNFLINIYKRLYPEPDSAYHYVKLLLENQENNIHGLNNKALYFLQKGNEQRAAAIINKALQIEPLNIDSRIIKATCYERMNLFSIAEGIYEKVLLDDPNQLNALGGLLIANRNKNNFLEAIKYGKKAIAVDSNYVMAYYDLGMIYSAMMIPDTMLFYIKKAHSLEPRDLTIIWSLINAFHSNEQMDSICFYKKLFQTEIKRDQIYLEGDKAVEDLNFRYSGYCDNSRAEYYYQRGIAFFNLKDFSKGIDIYNRGIEKFPSNFFLHHFKGNTEMAMLNYDNAIVCYKRAIELEKSSENFKTPEHMEGNEIHFIACNYYSLAEAYARIGEFKQSNEVLNSHSKKYGNSSNEMLQMLKNNVLVLHEENKNNMVNIYDLLKENYENSKNAGQPIDAGYALIDFIYQMHSNSSEKIYNFLINMNKKQIPLYSNTGLLTFKKKVKTISSVQEIFDIITELQGFYPNQLELYILNAYMAKEFDREYCTDLKYIHKSGFSVLDNPYWKECR